MARAGSRRIRLDDESGSVEAPSSTNSQVPGTLSRRQVVCAAAIAGMCAPLLAGCGSSNKSANAGSSHPSSNGGASGGGSGSSGGGSSGGGGGGQSASGGGGSTIATTSQVPKGGGVILPQDGVVITQPKPGEFKGFSATCTHAGCTLHDVSHGTINCICHGSRFSIMNGSVVRGPAFSPLPKVRITVHGKDISLG